MKEKTIIIPRAALEMFDNMEKDYENELAMRKTCQEAAKRKGCKPTMVAKKLHELFPRWSVKALKYYVEFYMKQKPVSENIQK